MSTEYDINYEDDRFKTVESEKQAALTEHEKTYDSMISGSDKYYDKQIQASKDWDDTQTKLQNEQTDFAIEQIEQQKDQAKKDYTKEQSGAYVDWQKQSDKQGVRAEQIADMGMQNTGYSESAQVSMYNTYQNRVMTARESYNRALQNYNNSITQARLQNNSALAEIAYKALQQQLELSLQGFQYKNQLLLDKANQKLTIEDNYYNRYQDVLNQINTENALAEQIRQFNESLAEERRQFDANFNRSSGGGGGSRRSSGGGGSGGGGGGLQLDNSGAHPDALPADTAKSLLALGEGPISPSYANSLVQSGKVNVGQSTTTGNPIYSKGGLSNDFSHIKPSASSSSKSSSSSKNIVQKAWDAVKKIFD